MSSAYLFDLDGTLIDRSPSLKRFLPEQYARYRNADTVFAEGFVTRFLELDRAGHAPKHEVYEALSREFELNAPVPKLIADFRLNAFKFCQPQPGALRVLEQLRAKGTRLGVITNGSIQAQAQKLEASGLVTLVELRLISEAVEMHKPEPEIFLEAARRFDVLPSNYTFVGDETIRKKTLWGRRGQECVPSGFDMGVFGLSS